MSGDRREHITSCANDATGNRNNQQFWRCRFSAFQGNGVSHATRFCGLALQGLVVWTEIGRLALQGREVFSLVFRLAHGGRETKTFVFVGVVVIRIAIFVVAIAIAIVAIIAPSLSSTPWSSSAGFHSPPRRRHSLRRLRTTCGVGELAFLTPYLDQNWQPRSRLLGIPVFPPSPHPLRRPSPARGGGGAGRK